MIRYQTVFAVVCVLVASGHESAAEPPVTTDAKSLYQSKCAVCHGDEGRGDGDAAYLLQPKPRNFRLGKYRIVSTDNLVPTEADLVRTITKGLPGTAMPPWPELSEVQKQQLAKYIMEFLYDEILKEELASDETPEDAKTTAAEAIMPGKNIDHIAQDSKASAVSSNPEELKASFVTLCAKCHGEDGTGKDDPSWRTQEGYGITSRNFKEGVFKGGRDDIELFRRIYLGMPGTPMASFGAIPPKQIWQMVRYIQSLADPKAQEKSWIIPAAITVQNVGASPSSVTDGAWNSITASEVRLFELWDNPEAVPMATVRAVSDGEQLTVLLSWRDPKKDVAGRSTTAFNDRAAIMLSADKEPPLFTMGRPGRDVEIWQWVPSPPSSIDNGAHNDIYPSKKAGWAQKRSADEGDFSTAKHVGNPVSRSHGGGTLFKAAKFGSLTAVPGSEDPSADAQWAKGEWKVMFRRPLHTTRADDIEFSGGNISVAFGIWDGRLGQRNGQKSVSIWGNLLFKKGK